MRSDHHSSAEALAQKMNEQVALLERAITDIRQDKLRDISTMDAHITALCSAITALPENEATQVEPVMVTMIGKLEEFAAALENYQNRMTEKAGDLPTALSSPSSAAS